jgi:hypothetical protein
LTDQDLDSIGNFRAHLINHPNLKNKLMQYYHLVREFAKALYHTKLLRYIHEKSFP